MAPLYEAAPKLRGTIFAEPIGLHCPQCGTALRVRQFLELLVLFGVPFATALAFSALPLPIKDVDFKDAPIWLGVSVGGLWSWCYSRRFAILQRAKADTALLFPLDPRSPSPEDVELQRQEIEAREEEIVLAPRRGGASWVCKSCREENPAEFGSCWKCGITSNSR